MDGSSARIIENLIYSYAEYLDLGKIDLMAELFVHADLVNAEESLQVNGADAIARIYKDFVRLYPDGTPCTHHVTSNVIIEVEPDDQIAIARSYFTVFQAAEGLPLQPIITGRYHDQFARINGHWCFTRRKILACLEGDLSRHQRN